MSRPRLWSGIYANLRCPGSVLSDLVRCVGGRGAFEEMRTPYASGREICAQDSEMRTNR